MGKSKKSLPGGAGQRDLSKNAIKKGHGLKNCGVRFFTSGSGPKRQVHSSDDHWGINRGCTQEFPATKSKKLVKVPRTQQ